MVIHKTEEEVVTQLEDEASHSISPPLQTLEIVPHVRYVEELGILLSNATTGSTTITRVGMLLRPLPLFKPQTGKNGTQTQAPLLT